MLTMPGRTLLHGSARPVPRIAADRSRAQVERIGAALHDYFATGFSRRFFEVAHPEPLTVTQHPELEVR